MPDLFIQAHRAPIILAAERNNVPAVYGFSYFARDGGLLSYGAVPTRAVESGDEASGDGISHARKDDRDRPRLALDGSPGSRRLPG